MAAKVRHSLQMLCQDAALAKLDQHARFQTSAFWVLASKAVPVQCPTLFWLFCLKHPDGLLDLAAAMDLGSHDWMHRNRHWESGVRRLGELWRRWFKSDMVFWVNILIMMLRAKKMTLDACQLHEALGDQFRQWQQAGGVWSRDVVQSCFNIVSRRGG